MALKNFIFILIMSANNTFYKNTPFKT